MNQTERAEILQMIENGQVSAEQAIEMLSPAQETPASEETTLQDTQPRRYLHIRVTNLETGKNKVNVNLPLQWMKLGWTLCSRFMPELEDMEELMSPLDKDNPIPIIEVENRERVEIYIE